MQDTPQARGAESPCRDDLRTLHGGCHCGDVRFEVDIAQRAGPIEVLDCTCSICRMTGFLHLIVPAARFRLLQGDASLVDYRFNTGVACHRFCGRCGVKSFYVPRSHPDGIDINVRCLDVFDALEISVSIFDDADRDSATAAIAHLSQAG